MNRKILTIAMAVITTIMLAASINMAFATTTYVDYQRAGAVCVINVPGHTPWIQLYFFGQMTGNYYSGIANRLMFYVNVGTSASPSFVPTAGYEDNPTRSAFSSSLGLPTEEHVVAPGQIGIFRVGNFEIVYWTIPLEIPVTFFSTTVVTLPPGMLILQGYGDKLYSSVGPVAIGPTGWDVQYSYYYYDATATLFCPGWHYFGPVGQGLPDSLQPVVIVNMEWIWTHA